MIQTIERGELARLIRDRKPHTLIEVGEAETYGRSHLPGAIHLTESEITTRPLPPRPGPIILYPPAHDSPYALRAAHFLDALGYEEIYYYTEGKEEWELAMLPTVSDVFRAHKHLYR